MSYIVDNLMEDEIFIYRARLHWIMLVPPVIIAPFSFIVLSSFLPYGYRVHTGIAIFIGVILTILYKTSLYISTEFAITNRRIIVKTGIIRNDSFEIMLQKIEGIKVTQGIIGRLLDYGSIVVTGTGGSKDEFNNISSPLELRMVINEQIDSANNYRVHRSKRRFR